MHQCTRPWTSHEEGGGGGGPSVRSGQRRFNTLHGRSTDLVGVVALGTLSLENLGALLHIAVLDGHVRLGNALRPGNRHSAGTDCASVSSRAPQENMARRHTQHSGRESQPTATRQGACLRTLASSGARTILQLVLGLSEAAQWLSTYRTHDNETLRRNRRRSHQRTEIARRQYRPYWRRDRGCRPR